MSYGNELNVKNHRKINCIPKAQSDVMLLPYHVQPARCNSCSSCLAR